MGFSHNKSAEFPQVKGGVSEGDFKFKLVTVGDSGVRRPKGCRSPKTDDGIGGTWEGERRSTWNQQLFVLSEMEGSRVPVIVP